MAKKIKTLTAVVIPNWNEKTLLASCLQSLAKQTCPVHIIVVDNGSTDGSADMVQKKFPGVELIRLDRNYGFTGGVNAGMERAIELNFEFVALLNNDALADNHWGAQLQSYMQKHSQVGIATPKIVNIDGKTLDSTGEFYTVWGLPYARGRGEPANTSYETTNIFGASGGASIYRTSMLKKVGLFDDDFFAYYEDVDISFRARLAGWQISYVPRAVVKHRISVTANKISGFRARQTLKNLPWILIKDVPAPLFFTVLPRLALAHAAFLARAISRGQGWPAAAGTIEGIMLWPKKFRQRAIIQKTWRNNYAAIAGLIIRDLPPDASGLRKLRQFWWRILGKEGSRTNE